MKAIDRNALKNSFDAELVRKLGADLHLVYPELDVSEFECWIMLELESLEMKARASRIAEGMRRCLPSRYTEALAIILSMLEPEEARQRWKGLHGWPLMKFVGQFGVDDFEESTDALRRLTGLFSAEFAIRPFIERYPERMMSLLKAWVDSDDHHVRRLVSEGTRPLLPWGGILRSFQADPEIALPLLERLKDDPSEYVRRSVANHLNDITKDHPERALQAAAAWYADGSKERRWIVRHGLRTLIKKGHSGALAILGFQENPAVSVSDLAASDVVVFGEAIELSVTLSSESSDPTPLVVDYVIHHLRKNGELTPKTFKLKTFTLDPGKSLTLKKRHSIRKITTRTYYPGLHRFEVQMNGNVVGGGEFELEMADDF